MREVTARESKREPRETKKEREAEGVIRKQENKKQEKKASGKKG